jgi:soluble lytic murein transglycosylase
LLSTAARTREVADEEVAYWRGRLAELAGDGELALDEYLRAATERPFHPFARAARARWAAPPLAELARARGLALAGSSDPRQLWTSHVLAVSAGGSSPMQARALARLAQYPATEAWVTGESLAVADWPLWRTALESPQEKLLALGLAVDAPAAVSEHFPADPARTGLTGATLLAPAPTTRRGIALAERVFSRRPRQVPLEWVSPHWLSVLYPRPWAELIESQAAARGVDPALLTAVLREESRFDAAAVSPAAARGLAQFVLPTARRLAPTTGLATLAARDLHDPMVAIPLAASYLAELARRFQGDEIAMAAAYNAGEDQTALWQRGCASAEPEELLSKITFGETRAYVTRVLESRDAYRWLARSSH